MRAHVVGAITGFTLTLEGMLLVQTMVLPRRIDPSDARTTAENCAELYGIR